MAVINKWTDDDDKWPNNWTFPEEEFEEIEELEDDEDVFNFIRGVAKQTFETLVAINILCN